MENNVSHKIQRTGTNISDEILAELFLKQILIDFKKRQILEKIDHSLQSKDKAAFLRLTEELISIS